MDIRNGFTRKMTLSGLFIALGMVLPFMTGQIPEIGNMMLPMHIPVMICGYVCGWKYGLVVGFIVPLLRGVILTMPPIIPTGLTMAFELAIYGAVCGALYAFLKDRKYAIYVSLIVAMLSGRVVWGIVSIAIYGVIGNTFTWTVFIAGALFKAVPGIILQLVLIPLIIYVLKKNKLLDA